jgi:hypothetical protein
LNWDCEIPFDAGRIAEVIERAEDEVFALLKSNWPAVERVVDALCKQDRITTPELDALMVSGKRRRRPKSARPERTGSDSAGPNVPEFGDAPCPDSTSCSRRERC